MMVMCSQIIKTSSRGLDLSGPFFFPNPFKNILIVRYGTIRTYKQSIITSFLVYKISGERYGADW